MVRRTESLRTMEYRRWLDELNVLVKKGWQTIFGRAHEDIAVLVMLPYTELLVSQHAWVLQFKIARSHQATATYRTKHLLRLRDRHVHRDPIPCG